MTRALSLSFSFYSRSRCSEISLRMASTEEAVYIMTSRNVAPRCYVLAIYINRSPQMYGIYIMLLFLKLDKCKTCGFLDVDRRRAKPVVVGFIWHVGWQILCSFDGLRVCFGKYERTTVSVLKVFINLRTHITVVFSWK